MEHPIIISICEYIVCGIAWYFATEHLFDDDFQDMNEPSVILFVIIVWPFDLGIFLYDKLTE